MGGLKEEWIVEGVEGIGEAGRCYETIKLENFANGRWRILKGDTLSKKVPEVMLTKLQKETIDSINEE